MMTCPRSPSPPIRPSLLQKYRQLWVLFIVTVEVTRKATMKQWHLHWQLNLSRLDSTDLAIATAIVDTINEDGYLTILPAQKKLGKDDVVEVDMTAQIYSSPIAANGVLYVATHTHLFAIATTGDEERE